MGGCVGVWVCGCVGGCGCGCGCGGGQVFLWILGVGGVKYFSGIYWWSQGPNAPISTRNPNLKKITERTSWQAAPGTSSGETHLSDPRRLSDSPVPRIVPEPSCPTEVRLSVPRHSRNTLTQCLQYQLTYSPTGGAFLPRALSLHTMPAAPSPYSLTRVLFCTHSLPHTCTVLTT